VWQTELQDDSPDTVTLLFRCSCGQTVAVVPMSMAEYTEHAGKILDWRKRDNNEGTDEGRQPGGQS
jgi:hypothetical protein